MNDSAIKIENVVKEYRLGAIGGGTLRADLQSWWAKIRCKDDPNRKLNAPALPTMNTLFRALDGINLEVKKGEALGIIGHNGAGKSTLLKLLARVTAPTSGAISFNGRVASMLEVGTGFHPEMTGRENIYMNGAILGMSKREIDSKLDDIIAFAEMEQFIDTPVKRYSSGMYVKLAFAVAAHLDSEIMIMDEVLAVGDMKFQKKCLGKMGHVATEGGKTILYVSHNMGTIRQLCSRCVVLNQGKIVFDGDVDQAIDLYLANDANAIKQEYDVSNYKRDKSCSCDVMINRIEFMHQNAVLKAKDEYLNISIDYTVQKKRTGINLRITISDDKMQPIGICTSDNLDFVTEGKNTLNFSVPCSMLMQGKYNARILLYQSVCNNVERLDLIDKLCCFEKEPDPRQMNTEYHRSIVGCIHFGPMKIYNVHI